MAKREAGKRRGGWLRVFVAAPDRAGVAPRLVGPVQVARQDTVEQVESRIRVCALAGAASPAFLLTCSLHASGMGRHPRA